MVQWRALRVSQIMMTSMQTPTPQTQAGAMHLELRRKALTLGLHSTYFSNPSRYSI